MNIWRDSLKAVQIVEPGKIDIIDMPIPEMKDNELIVRINYIGLCGSDLNTFCGVNPLVSYPLIPGHEISGNIYKVGSKVPAIYRKGIKVTVSPYSHCGKCSACLSGRVNCCVNNKTLGVQKDGAACEYLAVSFEKVFPVENLKDKTITLIEPLSIGLHAVKRAKICNEDVICVFGCGMIGLGVVFSSALISKCVIAVDIQDEKLEKARNLGADYCINADKKNIDEALRKITREKGVNVIFEAVGSVEIFENAIEIINNAGRIITIGYTKEVAKIETKKIVNKEIDIIGSRNALNDEIRQVIDIVSESEEKLDKVITQTYGVDEAERAFSYWVQSRPLVTKIVLNTAS